MTQISAKIVHFYSELNRRELPYYVILPVGYENSNENFPVLYLLHGLFGRFDNWISNTDLLDYAQEYPLIIVCAEGGDSWYTDSAEIENHLFESYLLEELIPDVEQRFKARGERKSRAVAGLSMGGYGAFKLAFRRPEMFCFAASMSGAFHAAEIFGDVGFAEWRELQPSICKVFGSDNQKIRDDNNLFEIVNNFPSEQISRLPDFYFDCGVEDSFFLVNLHLREIFRNREIAHDFRKFPGGHDWNYWNRHLRQVLQVAQTHLAA